MVSIPAGVFTMGSPKYEPERRANEGPQHSVTLGRFFIGAFPVTQAQWAAAVTAHPDKLAYGLDPYPSFFKGDDLPVESIAWNQADEFCRRLAEMTRRDYHLPSEAEWEYSCRAGSTGPFNVGPTITKWASVLTGARGLWGEDLRRAMLDYNQMIGVKMVGEMLPNEANRVTLADDQDQYGLRVAKITYAWGENDKALVSHALDQMSASIQAIGAKDMFRQEVLSAISMIARLFHAELPTSSLPRNADDHIAVALLGASPSGTIVRRISPQGTNEVNRG